MSILHGTSLDRPPPSVLPAGEVAGIVERRYGLDVVDCTLSFTYWWDEDRVTMPADDAVLRVGHAG